MQYLYFQTLHITPIKLGLVATNKKEKRQRKIKNKK
jgi:hypothetical protein